MPEGCQGDARGDARRMFVLADARRGRRWSFWAVAAMDVAIWGGVPRKTEFEKSEVPEFGSPAWELSDCALLSEIQGVSQFIRHRVTMRRLRESAEVEPDTIMYVSVIFVVFDRTLLLL